MSLYQSYDLILSVIALWISYLLAIAMLAILSYRFFLWLKFHKSLLIASYGIAASTLALNLMLALMLVMTFVYVLKHSIAILPFTWIRPPIL